MKTRLAMLAAALLAALAGAATAAERRVPLVGYVDRSGRVIEPASYESGSIQFRGDWVAVGRDGKSGYLNLRTRASTGLVFDGVVDDYQRILFANGPEPARIGDKWGFVDETGKVVIAPRFDGARGFGADGLALIEMDGPGGFPRRQGFIDKAGLIVVQPRYDMLRPYGGGLAVFRQGDRYGAIDLQGREVIPARFGWLGGFADNGLAPASLKGGIAKEGSKYGFVDRGGRFVIPERFLYAGSFSPTPADGGLEAPEGLARVVLANRQSAYVDASGGIVTRFPAGVSAWGISPNGLVRFQDQKTAKYGFADRTGAIAIAPRFEQVGGFDAHGLASAQENGKAGYISADGRWAIEPRFTTAGSFDSFGQAQAVEDGKSVLIDRTGRVVATLSNGGSFYWQQSEYAGFRTYPPQVDYPPEQFGGWRLERTLYAVPESASLTPTPTGLIRLTFRTGDGLVRWLVETEGWVIAVRTDQGPDKDPDVTRQNRLAALPPKAGPLLRLMARQLGGTADFSISTTPPLAADREAQRERLRLTELGRQRHLAELAASAADLERALAAMQARIREQFGPLAGLPCPPSECLY